MDLGGCSAGEPFALQVTDNSMEPEFKMGNVIIIDPTGLASHGAYVLAMVENGYIFRQFIIDNKKLTYIRSYNNSSVGMMQINERVWRGIYNIEHLRWDITYNVAAGIDILNLYLRKYALPKLKSFKGKDVLDNDGVAYSLYAMYNEGPGGFSRYVKRRSSGKYSDIDNHFKEKYTWVKSSQWGRVRDCF